jgi:hypothetical protein
MWCSSFRKRKPQGIGEPQGNLKASWGGGGGQVAETVTQIEEKTPKKMKNLCSKKMVRHEDLFAV